MNAPFMGGMPSPEGDSASQSCLSPHFRAGLASDVATRLPGSTRDGLRDFRGKRSNVARPLSGEL